MSLVGEASEDAQTDESFEEFIERVQPNLEELAEMDVPFSDTAAGLLELAKGGVE